MDDRNNTIAGWFLFAGIIALGAALLTGEIFHGDDFDSCTAGDGYCPPYVADAEAALAATSEGPAEEPLAFYLNAGSASDGEAKFAQCRACHAIAPGGANGIGPNVYDMMGGPIAGVSGFAYSDALAGIGGNWDWENMNEWLKKPSNFAPGTKMTFAGITDPQDRANMLLYLNSQGSGIAVPPPPPPAEEGEETAAEDEAAEGDVAEEGAAESEVEEAVEEETAE